MAGYLGSCDGLELENRLCDSRVPFVVFDITRRCYVYEKIACKAIHVQVSSAALIHWVHCAGS